ncbi:MAG: site-2 protease family protein [Alicyclobacillus sp.]|nr:site-2 protease family protein [Alicyclobacillus sp.]
MSNLTSPYFIIDVIVIVVSLVLHEFAHAVTADALGDRTARYAGRITLNPVAHFDVLGLLMIVMAPIGWAKPVPIQPGNFRHPRWGLTLTALAGPASNLLLACICCALLKLFPNLMPDQFLWLLLVYGAAINVNLCVFNLIPLPPLDGSRVVASWLPPRQADLYARLDRYGPFILFLAVIVLHDVLFAQLFGWAFGWVQSWFGL